MHIFQTQNVTFPSVFSYRACHKISYLQLSSYMSGYTYIYVPPLFLHQLPLIAIFKSVLKAHEISQINKFCFCPSCQSISDIEIPGVGRVFILSPSSGTNPLEKKKKGFNYIPNYFGSCLRP